MPMPLPAAAALAVLQAERAAGDLASAVCELLVLLGELAEASEARPALQQMELGTTVRQLLPWRRVQVRRRGTPLCLSCCTCMRRSSRDVQ